MRQTPFEIAEKWYRPETVHAGINGSVAIPKDVHSVEFSQWLCTQYRLAMAKGIQIERGSTESQVMRGRPLAPDPIDDHVVR